MDHPYVLAWALMPDAVGAFRGPSSTSGIEILRDGAFRSRARGVPDGDRQLGLGLRGVRPVHGRRRPRWTRAPSATALRDAARRPDPAPVPPRLPVRAAARPAQPRVRQRRATATRSASRARVIQYDVDDYTRAGMAAARELWTQLFDVPRDVGLTRVLAVRSRLPDLRRAAVLVPRRRPQRGHAPDGLGAARLGGRPGPALLGSPEPLPRRLRQHADDRDVEPDADDGRAGAAQPSNHSATTWDSDDDLEDRGPAESISRPRSRSSGRRSRRTCARYGRFPRAQRAGGGLHPRTS